MKVSIGGKILLGMGSMIALALVLGAYGLSRLDKVRQMSSTVAEHDLNTLELLYRLSKSQNEMRVQRERIALGYLQGWKEGDLAALEREQEGWRQAHQITEQVLAELEEVTGRYEQIVVSLERQQKWGALRRQMGAARRLLRAVEDEVGTQFAMMRAGRLEDVEERGRRLDALRVDFDRLIEESIAHVIDLVELGESATSRVYEQARTGSLLMLLLVLALGIGVGIGLQRAVVRPLSAFMYLAERVGQGDLSQKAEVRRGDEIGQLGMHLNEMVKGLRDTAGQTREVVEALNAAAGEILASSQQQASATAEQVAAVQQTSTTVEEIRQSGQQVSERAQEVATSGELASVASSSGLQAVEETVRAMEAIRQQVEAVAENIVGLSEKTQAVGQIIATVDEISEQSNLLALNAAIEAAAAGEQGRSFAVVAEEVKHLADQARAATVQVRSLLGEIQGGINTSVMLTEETVKRVESGGQRVSSAEGTIREMAGSIEASVQAFQQIVGATNQQQIGLEQVGQALDNIRQATEQTAVSTRQLEGAVGQIEKLGGHLQQVFERFRL